MVINYYERIPKTRVFNPNYGKLHFIKIPFRMLIAGGSGSGKTNTLMNILKVTTGSFYDITICVKSKDEPLYKNIEDNYTSIIFYENEVPELPTKQIEGDGAKSKKKDNALIIFDDLVNSPELNRTIQEYYLRARKFNISCIYISQSFYSVHKFIRQNCTYIILMSGLMRRDFKLITTEFNIGIDKLELETMYNKYVTKPLEFMMIHLFSDVKDNRRICVNSFVDYIA